MHQKVLSSSTAHAPKGAIGLKGLTLSGRENFACGRWVGVASAKSRVGSEVLRPLIQSGGGRRVPRRRQCGRYPWASPNLYGSGLSIAVGVILTTAFTTADRSPKASISFEVRSIRIDQKRSV